MAAINLITKDNGILTAVVDARVQSLIQGDGVSASYKQQFEPFVSDISRNEISVHPGMGILCGRVFISYVDTLVVDNAQSGMYTIYVEVDTTVPYSHKAEIKYAVNTSSSGGASSDGGSSSLITYPDVESGDDLINTDYGVAKMVLYRFEYIRNQGINQNRFIQVTKLLYSDKVNHSLNSDHATNADNAAKVNDIIIEPNPTNNNQIRIQPSKNINSSLLTGYNLNIDGSFTCPSSAQDWSFNVAAPTEISRIGMDYIIIGFITIWYNNANMGETSPLQPGIASKVSIGFENKSMLANKVQVKLKPDNNNILNFAIRRDDFSIDMSNVTFKYRLTLLFKAHA